MIDTYTDFINPGIKRSNLDFSAYTGSIASTLLTESFETLFTSKDDLLNQPEGIALDAEGGKVYWTDPPSQKIQRGNIDEAIKNLPAAPILFNFLGNMDANTSNNSVK